MYFSSGIDYTKLLHIKNFVVYLYTKEIRNEYQSVDGGSGTVSQGKIYGC